MEQNGFFASALMLAAVAVIFSFVLAQQSTALEEQRAHAKNVAAMETAFKRTQAEIYFDRKIEHTLYNNSFPLDGKKIKTASDLAVIDAFNELSLFAQMCSGKKVAGELNAEMLKHATRVNVVKARHVTIIEYIFIAEPCAEISALSETAIFQIPRGYSQKIVVATP